MALIAQLALMLLVSTALAAEPTGALTLRTFATCMMAAFMPPLIVYWYGAMSARISSGRRTRYWSARFSIPKYIKMRYSSGLEDFRFL